MTTIPEPVRSHLRQIAETLRVSPITVARAAIDPDQLIGAWCWDQWGGGSRPDTLASLGLPGWPQCGCQGCGCTAPATTRDDGGIPVCDECDEYVTDDAGDVHCSRMPDVEVVVESCGAGNQTHSYALILPRTYDYRDISSSSWISDLYHARPESGFPDIDPTDMSEDDVHTLADYLRSEDPSLSDESMEYSREAADQIESLLQD